ncbi:MAG TPA: EfeM/EfeO family lipoprotein [Baekduia sp.]|uniref:EfeM/EfeO family lipoprotein n=1 Tax=Baekduia sp. TaxID=2600305 RepID=UPI002BE5EB0E|nr:EfeM/EfeO family lipoprotein [Baekduia sp.]HMJ34206.1 EfeM/EfeO family lipoprotein [Baekduia sp.]
MRRAVLATVVGVAVLAAGCGGGNDGGPSAGRPPAAKLASRVVLSGNIPRVRPADFRAPTAAYRRHVRATLKVMLQDVARLRSAVAANDLAAARRAWLAADERYEEIGAAYGAFGALDAAVNRRPAGLPGGERSRDFTGLHRVELALFERGSTRDAAPAAARLSRDVARLRTHVGRIQIDPLEYSLRAHEVLEDTLHLQLSGQASPWSGAALTALRGNLRGTRVVVNSLRKLLVRRNPAIVTSADRALSALDRALTATERHGALPRWDTLPQTERERLAGLTAAAAERLAYVPELVDPRPARPVQRAFGDPEVQ